MSTSYRELKKPWSSIRVEDNAVHTKITLWQGGACCGTLTVSREHRDDVLWQFFENDAVATRSALPEGRTGLTIFRQPRVNLVLSEYGDLELFDNLMEDCDSVGHVATHV